MDVQTWLVFCCVAFIATVTPGPAILLAVSHSIACGLRAAVFTILGNVTGLLLLSSLAVAGLSVIILTSATLFTAVKVIGAFYLIYLGIKLWRHGFAKPLLTKKGKFDSHRRKRMYLNGFFVAVSNPKAIAFTTALFPQFISPHYNLLPQFLILVTTFIGLSFLCINFYAYLATRINSSRLISDSRITHKIFGGGFVAGGLALLGTARKY